MPETIEQESKPPQEADVGVQVPQPERSTDQVVETAQEHTAELEIKKTGWRERGNLARRMLTSPVIANGLNRIREVDVKALMDSAVSTAATGKDHIVHAGVVAGIMALDASGLEDAHIVGKSHELVGLLGKTLTNLGSGPGGSRSAQMAGSLFTKTAGFMRRHPGSVQAAEERMERALHEKIKKLKGYG